MRCEISAHLRLNQVSAAHPVEPVSRAADAQGHNHVAGPVADGGGQGVEANRVLLDRSRSAQGTDAVKLRLLRCGEKGVRDHRLDAGEQLGAAGRREVLDEDLAAGRAVQCSGVSRPTQLCVDTVQGSSTWSTLTIQPSCSTARLIVLPSSAASRSQTGRPCLVIEPVRDWANHRDQPESEAVFAAVGRLLHQPPALQRPEQPNRSRLVDADLHGDLADAGLAAPV
jgi:hypothetical protein